MEPKKEKIKGKNQFIVQKILSGWKSMEPVIRKERVYGWKDLWRRYVLSWE